MLQFKDCYNICADEGQVFEIIRNFELLKYLDVWDFEPCEQAVIVIMTFTTR